jgi:hypothetical protein
VSQAVHIKPYVRREELQPVQFLLDPVVDALGPLLVPVDQVDSGVTNGI